MYTANKNDSTTVAFIDSGIGGLVFAIDSIKKMSEICASNKANHTLNFIHIGDTKNVPYGLKTPSQLIVFIENLLEKCKNLGAKIVVIACNTACTVIDEDFVNNYKKQGLEIITIINKSAEVLYNTTPQIDSEKHILVLGTRQTISSNKYFEALLTFHKPNNCKLFVHQHSPIRWEQEVESGIKQESIQQMVDEDLANIRKEIGDDFTKIASVGLFCTHYPYLIKEIHNYFSHNTSIGNDIKLVSQGAIFGEEILKHFNNLVHFEQEINSYITGSNFLAIQSTIKNIHGSFPVRFDKI